MKLIDIFEKWGTDYETPESEKGKHADKTIAQLQAEKKKPGSDKRELNFAIRAKKAKGGKWKGVKAK